MNTEIKEWHKQTPKHVWKVAQDKTFRVEVVCWHKGYADEWAWNVYVYIYETHPLHGFPEFVIGNAPFHGGCTFDEKSITEPARGIEYDWQKQYTGYKFGSDYSHYMDEYFATCGPDNMPGSVIADANELVEWARAAIVPVSSGAST